MAYVDPELFCVTAGGGHEWRGGARCISCDSPLRCICGQFVREDQLTAHEPICPTLAKWESE